MHSHPASCHSSPKPWYRRKIPLLAVFLGGVLALSFAIPALGPFRTSFVLYLKLVWWALLLGVLLGGLIDYYVPREYISHFLAKPRKRTILHAVLLGFLMSACSHGILALTVELHKKGASNAAVVAFLLASPWANLPLTILLLGFFGLKALCFILGAILIAVTTGLIFQVLERNRWIETNPNAVATLADFSILQDLRRRFKDYRFTPAQAAADARGIWRGAAALANMVLWWILIGMAVASFAGAYIPPHFFHRWMGPTVVGMLVTLVLATILEVCSEGTAPLAFEIYRQTAAFGNTFVFLMAGVVTDLSEIGIIWLNVGRRTAIWMPIVAVPQVLFLGWLLNRFFR